MSHIIGVLDPSIDAADLTHCVESMVLRTREHAPALPRTAPCTLAAEASAASLQGTGWAWADTNIVACICGRPEWTDPSIAALQQQNGNAAALAEAYRRFGDTLLDKLHGTFAIAVLEPRKQKALLAVDRMGVCTLAWHRLNHGIAFATLADVLTAHPDISSTLDLQALFSYFYFEVIPSPETIFAGTRKLQPAQCLILDQDTIDLRFYWQIPYAESYNSKKTQKAELIRLLNESVAANLDEKAIGAFLSGGLDSSTVTGFFSKLRTQPVDVYGIGFEDAPDYDEMEYARATARHFGANLHEYQVKPSDVVQALPKLAAAYDEPFGNASTIPAYYCAKMAREAGKGCLLAGDGGDEIFAGNARYAKQRLLQLYHQSPSSLRKHLIDPLALSLPGAQSVPPLRKLRSYVKQARIPMPERLETYNFLNRTPLGEIFDPDFLNAIDTEAPSAASKATYEHANTDQMLKRMLALDMKNVIADNDLRKVTRTCEVAGIEVRYPMLDERLVNFAAQIPSDTLLKRFQLRDFYKKSLKDFLAPETLSKRKHGFGLPFGVWMTKDKQLQELSQDSIQGFRKHGYIQPAYINKLLESHRSEHADYYGVMISRVVMLQQWLAAHDF